MGRDVHHRELCDLEIQRDVPRDRLSGDASIAYARPVISLGPFKPAHLYNLNVQEAQRWTMAYIDPFMAQALEGMWSNTVFKNGHPICCGGVVAQRPDYGIVWSFVGADVTAVDFLSLHRLVKTFIGSLPFRRVEMHVDCEFTNGHRWAKALGFSMEAARMRGFLLNGGDASLYARIKR